VKPDTFFTVKFIVLMCSAVRYHGRSSLWRFLLPIPGLSRDGSSYQQRFATRSTYMFTMKPIL